MNLVDIESLLPNGLHDAKITSICQHLTEEVVDLHLDVLVGLPEDDIDHQNEYRPGCLRFSGAKIVLIEAPDVESSFAYSAAVSFVLTEDEPDSIDAVLLKKLQFECHTYTIFVQDWLSNIKIVAQNVAFNWN